MDTSTDKEVEAIQRRVQEIEDETAKLREMQAQLDNEMMPNTDREKEEADKRSVHVGNVDYAVTAEQLQSHFCACGTINRITIICDRYTGHPKGFAYVEFADVAGVASASSLNDTVINGRTIKITPKRTNIPGYAGGRGMRGRGGRVGRGRGRGGPMMYFPTGPIMRGGPMMGFMGGSGTYPRMMGTMPY